MGFWYRQDDKIFGKLFYSTYYILFPISTIAGALSNENHLESKILLVESAMISIPLLTKLLYVIWRKREILEFLNRICDYYIEDSETFTAVNNKLNALMLFVSSLFWSTAFSGVSIAFITPFVGREKNLFLRVGFPLDWRNDELSYWVTFVYVSIQMMLSAILVSFSIIIWYLMANCSWRYDVLGQEVLKMGKIRKRESVEQHRISDAERDSLYRQDLVETIKRSRALKE